MRTPDQVAAFRARLYSGLLNSVQPEPERLKHYQQQAMFIELERERLPDEPEPIQKPLPVREPPIDLVQLKAQVNFLQNKVMEKRVEKKKPPMRYESYDDK